MESSRQHIFNITADQFGAAVLQRSRSLPVVVDFWAEWCGPCKTLGPLLEEVTSEFDGAFDLVKIEVDHSQELASEHGVASIPTVIAFRDGIAVSRFTGAIPRAALVSWVEGFLPTELDRIVELARDASLDGNSARAEELFRQVLSEQSDHQEAGAGLAALRLAASDPEEALIILGKLSPNQATKRLLAAARLAGARGDDLNKIEKELAKDSESGALRMQLANALAGRNEFEPALDNYLRLVRAKGEDADAARRGMLDVFEILGDEHPLAFTYRRLLASALF